MKKSNLMIGVAFSLVGIGLVSFVNSSASNAESIEKADDDSEDLNNSNSSFKISDMISNSNVLLIGDSQIGRNIGKSFESISSDLNSRFSLFFKEGVTPKKILDNSDLKQRMLNSIGSSNPDVIIIQLGDNGISNTKEVLEFINLIKSHFNGIIIWIGAHPVTIPKKESSYVFTDASKIGESRYIDNYNKLKKSWNSIISSSLEFEKDVIFFDPLLLFPTGSYNLKDMSIDGIHLDRQASDDFVNRFVDFGE